MACSGCCAAQTGTSVGSVMTCGVTWLSIWATGTVCWLDPDAEAFCVLFTTQPQETEGRFLARLCNAVAAALV